MDDLKKLMMSAETDQAEAGLRNVARLVGVYFAALRKAGIEHDDAIGIVRDWQDHLFEMVRLTKDS